MRAGDACPVRRRERLAPDAPQVAGAPCTWHQASAGELVTIWPERYRAWAEANGLRSPMERRGGGAAGPSHATATAGEPRASARGGGLHVAHPADGTVFLIDPTLRPEFQAVPFRAGGAGGGEVSWTVNGRAGRDGRRRRHPCCGRSSAAPTSPSSATRAAAPPQVSFTVK